MAYFSPASSGFGEFGCGAGCSCKACQSGASKLSEVYEEDDNPPPPPPRLRTRRAPATMGMYFGQVAPFERRVSLLPGQLRMPAFDTVTGYASGQWRLTPPQLSQIARVAEHVVRTWATASPVTGIRLIGFADAAEGSIASQRTGAVRAALIDAINGLNPGILRGITFSSEDGGASPSSSGVVRRVEILLWIGLGTPFAPPPQRPSAWSIPRITVTPHVRIPTPTEAARTVYPMRPDTPAERVNRMLGTLPPAPAPRRSFNQMFWQRVDENLDSAMRRTGVPESLRGPLRNGAHAAIERGTEAVFNQVLDAAGLTGEAREAVSTTVRAAMQTPIPQ